MKININKDDNGIVTSNIHLVGEDGTESVIEHKVDVKALEELNQQIAEEVKEAEAKYSAAAKKGLANNAFMTELVTEYFTKPIVHDNAGIFINHMTIKRFKNFIMSLINEGLQHIDNPDPIDKLCKSFFGGEVPSENLIGENDSATEELVEKESNAKSEEVDIDKTIERLDRVIESLEKSNEETEATLATINMDNINSGVKEVDLREEAAKFIYDNMDKLKELLNPTVPELKIRYHREKYPDLPEVKQYGNFIDLYTAKGYNLKAGDDKLLDLGISVECPEGYWFELVPRSSTFRKYGVLQSNSLGVVDTEYCGDDDVVMFPAYATRNTRIPKGTRICQFTLVKVVDFTTKSVDKLKGPNRGGFGSTGNK